VDLREAQDLRELRVKMAQQGLRVVRGLQDNSDQLEQRVNKDQPALQAELVIEVQPVRPALQEQLVK